MDPLITTCDVVTEDLVVVKMSSLQKKETVNTECIQKCSIDSKSTCWSSNWMWKKEDLSDFDGGEHG